MTRALVQEPTRVPPVSRTEAPEVLPQWAYFHEFVRGDCKNNLNRLARLAGIDIHAKQRLCSDSVRQRLIGIQVLGSLRDRESCRLLRPLVSDINPYLSLAAAHALMRISPQQEISRILPVLASRADWPPGSGDIDAARGRAGAGFRATRRGCAVGRRGLLAIAGHLSGYRRRRHRIAGNQAHPAANYG